MVIFHRENDDQPEDLVGVAYFQSHICIHTMWYKNEGWPPAYGHQTIGLWANNWDGWSMEFHGILEYFRTNPCRIYHWLDLPGRIDMILHDFIPRFWCRFSWKPDRLADLKWKLSNFFYQNEMVCVFFHFLEGSKESELEGNIYRWPPETPMFSHFFPSMDEKNEGPSPNR